MPRPKGAPARLLDGDRRLRWWPSGDASIGKPLNRVLDPGESPQKALAAKLAELTAVSGNLIDVALAHLEAVPHDATKREYESRLRTWVLPHLLEPKGRLRLKQGRLPGDDLPRYSLAIDAFTNALLEAVLAQAVEDGATENTVDKIDAYLGALGSHLVNTDVLHHHPLGDKRRFIVKAWKKEAKRRNKPRSNRNEIVPDWDEVLAWSEAAGKRLERGAEAVLIYAGTGLRLAELPALFEHNINMVAHEVNVTSQLTRHDGIIPCPKDIDRRQAHYWKLLDPTFEKLIANAGPDGLLFPSERKSVWYDRLVREINHAAKDCGFNWTTTDLRRHYATYNLAPISSGGFGKSMGQVQRWMGHSHISITLTHYNRMIKQMGLEPDETFGDIHPSQLVRGTR